MTETAQKKKFLNTREVAERYGLSEKTVYQHVDAGLFMQPTRFGRALRWPITALDSWDAAGNPPPRQLPSRRAAS